MYDQVRIVSLRFSLWLFALSLCFINKARITFLEGKGVCFSILVIRTQFLWSFGSFEGSNRVKYDLHVFGMSCHFIFDVDIYV